MDGSAAAAKVVSAVARYGEAMVLKKRASTGAVLTSSPVMGFTRSYRPDELVGQLRQDDAEVTLSTNGLFPQKGDLVVIRGRAWSILGIDSIGLGGVIVAHRCWIRGG